MAAGVFAASTAAMAATQFVQSDMNFRNGPAVTSFDVRTEIGQLYTGDVVQIEGEADGSCIYVYSPKYGTSGWVNAGFLE